MQGTDVLFDGEPVAQWTNIQPTRTDHTITGTGLKLRRNPVKDQRDRLIEVGGNTLAEDDAVAVGDYASATGTRSVAVGSNSVAKDDECIAIGFKAESDDPAVVQLGRRTTKFGSTVAQRLFVGDEEMMPMSVLPTSSPQATPSMVSRLRLRTSGRLVRYLRSRSRSALRTGSSRP